MPARFEVGPQLDVIEDFSIKDDPEIFILVRNRLAAAAEVNDAQPGAAQPGFLIEQDAEFIWTTVAQHRQHLPHIALGNGPLAGTLEHACDAAHQRKSTFRTFPLEVFGNSARNSTARGTMNSSNLALQCEITSVSVTRFPGATINALI